MTPGPDLDEEILQLWQDVLVGWHPGVGSLGSLATGELLGPRGTRAQGSEKVPGEPHCMVLISLWSCSFSQ